MRWSIATSSRCIGHSALGERQAIGLTTDVVCHVYWRCSDVRVSSLWKVAPAVIAEARERILLAFNQHLERVAGIAPSTRARYLHRIRSFLRAAFGDRDPDCSQLRPEQVTALVPQCAERRALTSRKDPGTAAVRAFL